MQSVEAFSLPPRSILTTVSRLWVGSGCEGTQPGQLNLTDQRCMPRHMTSCSAVKSQWKAEETEGAFVVMAFVFPSNCYVSWGPAFQEVAGHCLPMWTSACIPLFGLLMHSFCFSCSTVIILIHEPSRIPSVFSPSCGNGEWVRGWVDVRLLAGVNPSHTAISLPLY